MLGDGYILRQSVMGFWFELDEKVASDVASVIGSAVPESTCWSWLRTSCSNREKVAKVWCRATDLIGKGSAKSAENNEQHPEDCDVPP